MFEHINYYGHDKESYISCLDLILESNQKNADITNAWFLIINILYYICAKTRLIIVELKSEQTFILYAVIIAAFMFVLNKFKKIHEYPLFITILNIVIYVSYGILISNSRPYMISFLFLIIILIMSISFIETFFKMVFLLSVSSTCYIMFTVPNKPMSIAREDIVNTIIMLGLSFIVHYTFQHIRINQFITYKQNMVIRQELEINSSFDSLTLLLNRGRFFSIAETILGSDEDGVKALCLVDLDEFKEINDNFGHQMGDKAIQHTGNIIIEALQMDLSQRWNFKDFVLEEKIPFAGRLGGDEFIIMFRGVQSLQEILNVVNTIQQKLNKSKIGDIQGLYASIGVTLINENERNLNESYKRADDALYTSKRGGKNIINVN